MNPFPFWRVSNPLGWIMKRTIIVYGKLALRSERLASARRGDVGVQVLSIEHVASRLAGGFLRVVDVVTLRDTISKVIPSTDLGEIDGIKMLPGFPFAAAATLMKLWMSGIDLGRMKTHPRIKALQALMDAVSAALPPDARPPDEIVRRARERLAHAPALFGSVSVLGMTELHPIWRSLLGDLCSCMEVKWVAGPRPLPSWLSKMRIVVETCDPTKPRVTAASCATARHEVIEAIRWARSLMAMGIPGRDIAIATTSTADYDDHFVSLAKDADLGIHFVHGISAVHTADGQMAAALADVLLRGLSQKRVRRLIDLIRSETAALSHLPEDWHRILPPDAALTTLERWQRTFERKSRKDIGDILMPFLTTITKGLDSAAEIGEAVLSGRALQVWRRALIDGPPAALDHTVQGLRVSDGIDPFSSPAFMNAAALATVPRKHVRLIGLSSRTWPRGISEDALVPASVISLRDLDPLPLREIDTRDFETILATTTMSVSLSWARRDADGRAHGISPMVPPELRQSATRLQRIRIPSHAMSRSDRLLAQPLEFKQTKRARLAKTCWEDWHLDEVTPHDGLVRPDHPQIISALNKYHSTTSLKLLIRDPIGFVWTYALGFKSPEFDDEPLTLDARHFGNILHDILKRTVEAFELEDGFANASPEMIKREIDFAAYDAGLMFQISHPVPAAMIWSATMANIVSMAESVLASETSCLPGQSSFVEVPFGGGYETSRVRAPWDVERIVKVPGTEIKIRGIIDRLDCSGDRKIARVTDYKSGKVPKGIDTISIDGGKELQRCLYGFAVRDLMGSDVNIDSRLLFTRGNVSASLQDPDKVLGTLAGHIKLAAENLIAGVALPGIDTSSDYNDLRFALPANAAPTYLKRKELAVNTVIGDVVEIWGEQ